MQGQDDLRIQGAGLVRVLRQSEHTGDGASNLDAHAIHYVGLCCLAPVPRRLTATENLVSHDSIRGRQQPMKKSETMIIHIILAATSGQSFACAEVPVIFIAVVGGNNGNGLSLSPSRPLCLCHQDAGIAAVTRRCVYTIAV